MANTDVGIAAGGLGKTIAAAIVQFNKASVTPRTVSMAPAVQGSNTVQFPIYSKLGISDVTNHTSATSLLVIDSTTKHTWVDTISASNHIYASASDSSEEASQDSHRVLLIDTASGKFYYTGSYGGSGEGSS